MHIKTLLDRYGVNLRYFRAHVEPYEEDYSGSTEDLLRKACRAVQDAVGNDRVFFIEDTTIRLEALSSADDYPGLAAKEWFAETTFAELDAVLKERGNDRKATVKSDIALMLPGQRNPTLYHGETTGAVASSPPIFAASNAYPWLNPHSFNGWFVPDGADRVLGQMNLEDSLPYDFRAKAVAGLVEDLERFTYVLNLPGSAYALRKRREGSDQQMLLIQDAAPKRRAFVVIGRTCAGKTTFSEYLEQKHGFEFLEASAIVRAQWRSDERGIPLAEFAHVLVEEGGADFVARRMIEDQPEKLEKAFVVSGFRIPEELELILEVAPDVTVVLLEAGERTRYARHLARGRHTTGTFEDFINADRAQWDLGLLRVARDVADVIVENEGTLDELYSLAEACVSGEVAFNTRQVDLSRNELFRCLSVLSDFSKALSPGEIVAALTVRAVPMRANNVNKALKAVPELARRFERSGRVRYQITERGRAYVRLLKIRASAET